MSRSTPHRAPLFLCRYDETTDQKESLAWINENDDSKNKTVAAVLIGSRAAAHHLPGNKFRRVQLGADYDLIMTPAAYTSSIDWDAVESIKTTRFFFSSAHKPGTKQTTPLPTTATAASPTNDAAAAPVTAAAVTATSTSATEDVVVVKSVVTFRGQGWRYEIEVPVAGGSSAKSILAYVASQTSSKADVVVLDHLGGAPVRVAPLTVLERIKWSHVYCPVQFAKTITDLHLLRLAIECKRTIYGNSKKDTQPAAFIKDHKTIDRLAQQLSAVSIAGDNCQSTGNPIETEEKEVTALGLLRQGEVEQRHGVAGAHINLNQSNEDFLDKEGLLTVRKLIPHDDIHELVMFGRVPMYTRIKTDPRLAKCDRKLFEALTLQERVQNVQEEIMVLALERYMLVDRVKDQDEAYRLACQRVCTTVTKGWFREFAIDHYPQVAVRPKDLRDICDRIQDAYKRREKLKRQKAIANGEPLLEWFDAEQLLDVKTIAQSFQKIDRGPSNKNGRFSNFSEWLTETDYRLTIGGKPYSVCVSEKTESYSSDCEAVDKCEYTIHLHSDSSSDDFEWSIDAERRTGAYDSNRDEVEYSFSSSIRGEHDPSNDAKRSAAERRRRQVPVTIAGIDHIIFAPENALLTIVLSYVHVPLERNEMDNHFLARLCIVLVQPELPYSGSSAMDHDNEKHHRTIDLRLHALDLDHKQRNHPFYKSFLTHHYLH